MKSIILYIYTNREKPIEIIENSNNFQDMILESNLQDVILSKLKNLNLSLEIIQIEVIKKENDNIVENFTADVFAQKGFWRLEYFHVHKKKVKNNNIEQDNDNNVKIQENQRKTFDASMDSLKENLFKLLEKYEDEDEGYLNKEELLLGEYKSNDNFYLFQELLSNGQVKKDLSKVEFDLENISYLAEDNEEFDLYPEFLGFNTTKTGLAYYGICANGDWEIPLLFILYYDGQNIRGYIPYYGNTYNHTTNKAFGNDEDTDEEYMKNIGKTLDDMYDLEPDINKILYDIEENIRIIKEEENDNEN